MFVFHRIISALYISIDSLDIMQLAEDLFRRDTYLGKTDVQKILIYKNTYEDKILIRIYNNNNTYNNTYL